MPVVMQYLVQDKRGVTRLTTPEQKKADLYDKMLNTSEEVSAFLVALGLKLPEKELEELSIAIATNKEPMAYILKGKSFDYVKDTLIDDFSKTLEG